MHHHQNFGCLFNWSTPKFSTRNGNFYLFNFQYILFSYSKAGSYNCIYFKFVYYCTSNFREPLQVIYSLLALTQVYGLRALEWAKDSISLIPSTAVTEVERTRFLQALSDVASGVDINPIAIPIEELSEVCRRNRTVQEIVQGALRPLELNLVNGIVA